MSSGRRLLQGAEERLCAELGAALPLQGPKQLVLTWPQLRKQLLLSQYLSGEGMLRAQPCPAVQGQTQSRISWKGLQRWENRRPYSSQMGKQAYGGGWDSLKSTRQVVARPVLEFSCPKVLGSPCRLPPPGSGQLASRVGIGPVEGGQQAGHWQALGDGGSRGGGESSSRPFPGIPVSVFF